MRATLHLGLTDANLWQMWHGQAVLALRSAEGLAGEAALANPAFTPRLPRRPAPVELRGCPYTPP